MIVVNDIRLDLEVMSIRRWWVTDPRIAGTPLSVYLYFREKGTGITQRDAMSDLGLGKDAFRTAKERLRRAGFMLEIRDRFPAEARDARNGEPKGGQLRFRIVLLDPAPGAQIADSESLVVADEPVSLAEETPVHADNGKPALGTLTTAENPHWMVKPQSAPSAGNPHWVPASADYPHSLKVDTGLDLDRDSGMGIDPVPSNPQGFTRESFLESSAAPAPESDDAALDFELGQIHPSLSIAILEREVRGRVELSDLDLVWASRVILEASRQPGGVKNPPAYVAKSIVADPERWRRHEPYLAGKARQSVAIAAESVERVRREACARGEHDWGPAFWPEFERSQCMRCSVARRGVDPVFAALEAAEFERSQ